MKKIFLLLLLLGGVKGYAQINPVDYFITLDKEMNPVNNQKKAKFFIHVYKTGEGLWQFDHYNFSGPMIRTESFKDEEGTQPHGFFAYYNAKGILDSCGNVFEKRKDGRWTYFDAATGKVYQTKEYDKGTHIRTQVFDLAKKEEKEEPDNKKLFLQVEVESEFPGGLAGWGRYLNQNLRYPERAIDLNKMGTAAILFIVDTEGRVTNPVIAQSVEFSIDQESLRIIKSSPLWTPAMQNGRKVKSYKKQPIIFKLT